MSTLGDIFMLVCFCHDKHEVIFVGCGAADQMIE